MSALPSIQSIIDRAERHYDNMQAFFDLAGREIAERKNNTDFDNMAFLIAAARAETQRFGATLFAKLLLKSRKDAQVQDTLTDPPMRWTIAGGVTYLVDHAVLDQMCASQQDAPAGAQPEQIHSLAELQRLLEAAKSA
jgi:hypothetical protein